MQNVSPLLVSFLVGLSGAVLCWAVVHAYRPTRVANSSDFQRCQSGGFLIGLSAIAGRCFARLYESIGTGCNTASGQQLRPFFRSLMEIPRSCLDGLLRSAGHPYEMKPFDVMGLLTIAGFAGAVVAAACYSVTSSVVITLLAGIIVCCLPLVWLARLAGERTAHMRKVLPYTLDLMTLCVESGLDYTQGMALIVEKQPDNPLAVELKKTLHSIQMGETRKDALKNLESRTNLAELTPVVNSLIQADESGAGLVSVLRVQADELRNQRFIKAEEFVLKASVKMLLPLVVFIFPVCFVVILGPMVPLLLSLGSVAP